MLLIKFIIGFIFKHSCLFYSVIHYLTSSIYSSGTLIYQKLIFQFILLIYNDKFISSFISSIITIIIKSKLMIKKIKADKRKKRADIRKI